MKMDCRSGKLTMNSRRMLDLFFFLQTSVFFLVFYFLKGSGICNLISADFIDNYNKLLLMFSFTLQ